MTLTDEQRRATKFWACAKEVAARSDELLWVRWHMGRKVGRTIYAQLGNEPSDSDPLIGVMDTRLFAANVVASHNAVLASAPEKP